MFGKLLDTATYLKAKIKQDDLQLALVEATNEDNWQASATTLHLISSSAYNHEKWQKIHEFLWDKLKNNKNWKKMLKAMNIVQFVLKNGPTFASNQMKYELNFFRTLANFDLFEDGIDRGAAIRERAKAIVLLLQNDQILEDERLRARQIREKMSHMSGSLNYSSEQRPNSNVGRLESYNNKSFEKTKEDNGYYNYGSGNYGDRQTDQKYNHDYFQNINRFKKTTQDPPKSTPTLPQTTITAPKETPAQSKPVVPVQSSIKNENGTRPKFQSITQKLLKNSTKTQQRIVKPDLSYKTKNKDEELIDTQANFVQRRYHFEEPQYSTSEAPASNGKTQLSTAVQKQIYVQNKPSVPTNTTVQPNLLSQLQGLNFLGIQTTPAAIQTNQVSETKPQSPSTNAYPTKANTTQVNPNPLSPVPQLQNPIITSAPTPPQQTLSYNNNPPQAMYTQSVGYAYAPQNIYGQPNVYGQASVYGQQNPYYAGSPYQAYNPYGYAANAYPTNYNPYGAYQQQPNTYQQPVSYQSGVYLPQHQSYSYTQPQTNPYQNLSSINMNLSPVGPPVQKKQQQTKPNSVATNNSPKKTQNSDFKIQNIDWLSGKEKSLTDISDLAFQIKPTKAQKKPKVEGNQVKIDPWAW